jgi:hypothetical protein
MGVVEQCRMGLGMSQFRQDLMGMVVGHQCLVVAVVVGSLCRLEALSSRRWRSLG